MPDIHFDRLSFTYEGSPEPVLRALDLVIPQGDCILLTGPSGCGKSTLALALAGFIPTRVGGHLLGSVYMGADNLSTMPIHEVAQRVGMVFQNPENQLVQLTVEEEVAFGPENLALPRVEIAQRVTQALASTGMEHLRFEQIYTLSGGQKQRVAIAAALAMRPKVLLLDEPTSDLDPVGTQEVLRVLRLLNQRYGMTIVLIEHKIDEVIPWVDRVLVMDQGALVRDTPSRQVFADLHLWHRLGLAVHQMVQLAGALPDIFQNTAPLSLDEVYDGLHNTRYARALTQKSEHTRPGCGKRIAAPLLRWDAIHLA